MADDGKAGSPRPDASGLAWRYREFAHAVADFAARHGEQTLIDMLRARATRSGGEQNFELSRDVQRQR